MNRLSHIALTIFNLILLQVCVGAIWEYGGGWLWIFGVWISGMLVAIQAFDACKVRNEY